MPLQNFVDQSTPAIGATWLNAIDAFYFTLFNSATTAAQARTALGSTAVGDALFTTASAAAARTTLGSTAVGDALFITTSAAAARTTLDVPSKAEAILDTIMDAAGDLIYATAADTPAKLAIGTARKVLTVNSGATAPAWSDRITLAAMVTASGNVSEDFTNIPSGVRRITIMFSELSTNGTASILVQIGDAGGIETSGYESSGGTVVGGGNGEVASSTAGFIIRSTAATNTISGKMVLDLMDAATFLWVASHSGKANTTAAITGGGTKSLSAVLDRVRITTANGTDVIDAGKINISSE